MGILCGITWNYFKAGVLLMSSDPNKVLINEAHEWIDTFKDDSNPDGAVYEWNAQRVKDFKDTSIETLLYDDYFLGLKDSIFDGVAQDIIDLFSERKKREVDVALFLEAIGSGKTFKASIIQWLLWFELSMHENPQLHYNLTPNSVIALMMMSRTETQAKRITFGDVWLRFQSPFNKDYFPVNSRYTNEIRISRNNTCVYAGTSSSLSILGYNVYSATIDEANFLEVIDDSKKSMGETYDAAEEMHNAVMNRMTSRFMKDGKIPGLLTMISSPRYPESFLERRVRQCKAEGEENLNMFWRSRSLWEAKGEKFFPSNKFFTVDTKTLKIVKEAE